MDRVLKDLAGEEETQKEQKEVSVIDVVTGGLTDGVSRATVRAVKDTGEGQGPEHGPSVCQKDKEETQHHDTAIGFDGGCVCLCGV